MKIKNKLKELRNKLLGTINENNQSLNETVLEDSPIIDSEVYRLHYVKYYTFGERYGYSTHELLNWPCDAFYLPKGMKKEDAFKVISYLTDRVEEIETIEKASLKSVCKVNDVLDLENLGFTRAIDRPLEDVSVVSLFTVDGNLEKFKESRHYPRYFEWYTPNISKEEITRIYALCGMEFQDLQFEPKGTIIRLEKTRKPRITKPQ